MKHEARCQTFNVKFDPALLKEVSDTVRDARVTVTEFRLMEAVGTFATDPEQAKKAINGQIQAWGQVGIVFSQIDTKLWSVCQHICRGQKSLPP